MSTSYSIHFSNQAQSHVVTRYWDTSAGWAEVWDDAGVQRQQLVETVTVSGVAQSNVFDRRTATRDERTPHGLYDIDLMLDVEASLESGARSGRLFDGWEWSAELLEVNSNPDDMPIMWVLPLPQRSRHLRELTRALWAQSPFVMRRDAAALVGALLIWEGNVVDDELSRLRAEQRMQS